MKHPLKPAAETAKAAPAPAETAKATSAPAEIKGEDVKEEAKAPKNKEPVHGAHFVKDVTIPDGKIMAPGQKFKKVWLVKNTGEVSWPKGTKIVALPGSNFGQDATFTLDHEVKNGENYGLGIVLTAPTVPGKYMARYSLTLPNGKPFGHKYWANIEVSKFPNSTQLKAMAMEFLADQKVVDILQSDLPSILKEIRQGKSLASIVDALCKKHPQLEKHTFIVFIRPFLESAGKFMDFQMNALIGMYSLWAQTPFATMVRPPVDAKAPAKAPVEKFIKAMDEKSVKNEVKKNELKKNELKGAWAKGKPAFGKPAVKKFKYERQFEELKSMGFKNTAVLKKLLLKHKGNSQSVLQELFGN